jgi:hypothetical protein
MNELETIINAPEPLTLSTGRVIDVTPIKTREFPAFTAALEPVFGMLAAGADVPTLMLRNSDAVIAATAIGLRIPRAELDDLELDDLVIAAAKVMEVNADFFARRVLPALNQTTTRMGGLLAGLMRSIASSPADTDSAT